MSWGYVAVAGATLVSGYLGSKGSKDAAKSGQGAQMAAIEEQRRQYDQSRQDMLPWLDAGRGALDRMNQAMAGDYSNFYNSPDYQFAYDQGMKAVQRGQPGNFWGGGQSADLARFGQGLATQNYGNWWNRNAGLANVGQTASQSLGGLGQNYANAYSTAMGNIGDIRSSSIQNQSNIWGNTIGQLGGLFGQYLGSRGSASSGQGSINNFGNNLDNFRGWGS